MAKTNRRYSDGTGSVVLGGSIDFPGHDGIKGLKLNGILVTDANEINELDGAAGTVVNTKAAIYDTEGRLNKKNSFG